MSRLFRRPSSKGVRSIPDDPNSVFSSLLDPVTTIHTAEQQQQAEKVPPHRRTKSSPGILTTTAPESLSSRPWLSLVVAERQQTTPQRKLVKDPGSAGSARPSFSHELSDHGDGSGSGSGSGSGTREDGRDRGGGVGMVRRGVERVRELYRREKG